MEKIATLPTPIQVSYRDHEVNLAGVNTSSTAEDIKKYTIFGERIADFLPYR